MKSILSIIAALLSLNILAQSFTGTIDFKYYSLRDTTLNTYWVKEPKIKLDQYAKRSNTIEGSFVFDLKEKNIKFVNPKRKVWGDQKSEVPPVVRGKCEVSKGAKNKMVNGYKCNEYIVKNEEENTVITYYITTDKYDFFAPMMEMWNRKDKQSIYFLKIKGLPKGSMPVLSEEKTLSDGKYLSKLEITKLNKGGVEDVNISIPAEYKKFDQ
jgi:hypothetical protein